MQGISDNGQGSTNREEIQKQLNFIRKFDPSAITNLLNDNPIRSVPLLTDERNRLAAWNCYNPLVLKDVKNGVLEPVDIDGWGRFAGKLEYDLRTNIEVLVGLNRLYYGKFLRNIFKAVDSSNPILLVAGINDLLTELGFELKNDFFTGAGIFHNCNLFIVDESNRSLGNDVGLNQKFIPGIMAFPGLIANCFFIEIESKFGMMPYYDRLERIPGETLKDSFDILLRKYADSDQLADACNNYLNGKISFNDLKSSEQLQQSHYTENTTVTYDDGNYTPPISATELSTRASISRSILSQSDKPLGIFFKGQCAEQETKTPRLRLDVLFPLLKETMRRSKEGNQINNMDDFKELFE